MRRSLGALLVASLALVVVTTTTSRRAAADDPTINAVEGRTVIATEPAIPGDYAADQGGSTFYPTPSDCTGVACANVPIHLDHATPPHGESVVKITISWPQSQGPGGQASSDELYFYVYHDPPNAKESASGPLTFETSGTVDPTSVEIADPDSTAYYLVVSNSVGVNNGFTVAVDYESGAFTAPSQPLGVTGPGAPSAAPQPQPAASPAPAAEPGPPSILGSVPAAPVGVVAVPTGSSAGAVLSPPPAGPAVSSTAGAFAGLDPGNVLQQITSSGPNIFRRSVAPSGPPPPTDDTLLWVWMAGVPLLCLIGGGGLLAWRRPGALFRAV